MFPTINRPNGVGLRQARRRLSVVSDNKLIEGLMSHGGKEDKESGSAAATTATSVVKSYWGASKKGFAPYNPRKRNQDSLVMEEHKESGSLLLGVFDGHGESGDLVSRFFTDRLPRALFANPKFMREPSEALCEEVDRLEQVLLSGECAWMVVCVFLGGWVTASYFFC